MIGPFKPEDFKFIGSTSGEDDRVARSDPDESLAASLANNRLIEMLPVHAGELSISHNEHKSLYEDLAQYIENLELADSFNDDEAMKRAIETNSLWVIQWYPDTPVGFFTVAAPTLGEALLLAEGVK